MNASNIRAMGAANLWGSDVHLGAIHLVGANVVNAAFGFLFWAAAARLYHPRDVGLAAAAVSAVGLLAMLSALGFDTYFVLRFACWCTQNAARS